MHFGPGVHPVQGHRGFQLISQRGWREPQTAPQVHLHFHFEGDFGASEQKEGEGFSDQGDTFAFQKTPLRRKGVEKEKRKRWRKKRPEITLPQFTPEVSRA